MATSVGGGRSLTDNRQAVHEFSGSTAQRELAAARQESKRAFERAIATAHLPPGGGPQVTASMNRGVRQDGKINS